MNFLATIPSKNCPQGLEYLTIIDQLFVKEQIHEQIATFDRNSKYTITNYIDQVVYIAAKENNCCAGLPFSVEIKDPYKRQTVLCFSRPALDCDLSSYPFWECRAPPENFNNHIGTVEQEWSILTTFSIKNETGVAVMQIEGPFVNTCGDVEYKVKDNFSFFV